MGEGGIGRRFQLLGFGILIPFYPSNIITDTPPLRQFPPSLVQCLMGLLTLSLGCHGFIPEAIPWKPWSLLGFRDAS